MLKYSKREIESAGNARELLARMGYPSVQTAIVMIKGGDNMGVTERDFRVAHDIWGKDVTSMRGKKKKMATSIADISIRPPIMQKEYSFTRRRGYATTVSHKSADMDRAQRTAAAINVGLDDMVGTMTGQGFAVTDIFSDDERAIGKLKYHLNSLGIEVDISGVGGHVARIERKIQMIKERARCHMTGRLPFTLTALGISMLILYCVSRLNFQKSGVTGGCPREEFSGRRVDGSKDFRSAFGDYVVCTVPETENNMEPRITDGYVVLPT